jgi:hypothetical protein
MSKLHSDLASAIDNLTTAREDVRQEAWLNVLEDLGATMTNLQEVAADVTMRAWEGGTSKAAIARALGIPVSTLRDLRKPKRNPDGLDTLRAMMNTKQ